MRAFSTSWNPASPNYIGRFRMAPTRANGRPALASWTRRPDDTAFRAFAIGVFVVEDGLITEMTAFHDPDLFPAFGLPMSLPDGDRLTR
jgi:RNA polymerase sigma-70 factor (ECF subfamily)